MLYFSRPNSPRLSKITTPPRRAAFMGLGRLQVHSVPNVKNQLFVLDPPLQIIIISNYSFWCTHLRVQLGHARRHGKWSLEMLTVTGADYRQEMNYHYFESWSVHKWNVRKSWLVLVCQLNIVVFGLFATFAVSIRLVLSVENEPEIAGPTAPATASTRHLQPECSTSVNKTVCFSTFWQSRHCW